MNSVIVPILKHWVVLTSSGESCIAAPPALHQHLFEERIKLHDKLSNSIQYNFINQMLYSIGNLISPLMLDWSWTLAVPSDHCGVNWSCVYSTSCRSVICHCSSLTRQRDFAFCCTVTAAESKSKVDKMVKVLEALMNEESHKDCLQARGGHG